MGMLGWDELPRKGGKYNYVEGNVSTVKPKVPALRNIMDTYKPKKIMEIGFNAGHSACVFLSYEGTTLHTFDRMAYNYSEDAWNVIKKHYGDRVTLVRGDTRDVLKQFFIDNPELEFDLIFVDGGHYEDMIYNDIKYTQFKVKKNGGLWLIDDWNGKLIQAGYRRFNWEEFDGKPTTKGSQFKLMMRK